MIPNSHNLTEEQMKDSFSILTNLLSPLSSTEYSLKPNHILSIADGKIASIVPATMDSQWDVDLGSSITLPGFIDTHVHLSQYRIQGHYRDALLPWLEDVVFPEEQKSASYEFAYALAQDFFQALYKRGTTTAVIYTAPYPAACEAAFMAAKLHNYRSFIGMTLMNQNSPDLMTQTIDTLISQCRMLIHDFHRPSEGQNFILTPRFAPTCSMELMQTVAKLAKEYDLWIQTHLSENTSEIQWVKELFGLPSYTQVYAKAGILTPKTILAHCLHLSEDELNLLRNSGSSIAHCPDSNFYLKSGKFPLDKIKEHGIPFAIGSDVGAGTSLDMLYHAKLYNYTQLYTDVSPAEALYRITLGAAKMLHLDDQIGSLETGKAADLVSYRLPDPETPLTQDILSQLVFTGQQWEISSVYAQGIRQV